MQLLAFSQLRHRVGLVSLFLFIKQEYNTILRNVCYYLVVLDMDDEQMHPPILNPDLPSGTIILY